MKEVDWKGVAENWIATNLTSVHPIPVFDSINLTVKVNNKRLPGVLSRDPRFDAKLESITDAVKAGYSTNVEGMLYVLYEFNDGKPAPVYVGIAEAKGHTGKLSSLFSNAREKPRFDDFDGYHIGDLSTQVIPGHEKKKAYKKAWAKRLFSNAPNLKPILHKEIYFWGKEWTRTDTSAVVFLGHTPLYLEEMVLIHAFRTLYPGKLLNC